jgi:carbamoyltransferase
LAHAAGAFFSSGLRRSHVLVVDGQGEYCSTSLWRGEDGALRKVWTRDIEDSLGYFYNAVTRFIGMRNGDEGKMMGLAPYGQPRDELVGTLSSFRPSIGLDELRNSRGQMEAVTGQWLRHLASKFGPARNTAPRFADGVLLGKAEYGTFEQNMAASAQHVLESEILDLVSGLNGNLCLAGGVALNCVANQRIAAPTTRRSP